LFFTDKGKVYQMKMYDIVEGRRATKGKSIRNYLSIAPEERVTSILAVPKELARGEKSLFLVTEKGVVKKVPGDSFATVRASGLIAINLNSDDTLLSAHFVAKGDDAFLATQAGQSIRFSVTDVRDMGRTAAGVRGIMVKKGDRVVGSSIVTKDMQNAKLLVVTENGCGKRTDIDEYKVQKRGGSGIKTVNVTPKTGKLIDARIVNDELTEMIVVSKKSQVIRCPLDQVPSIGRATQGVCIMKMRAGDSVASVSVL
jgi:DNA gyrase subunit A